MEEIKVKYPRGTVVYFLSYGRVCRSKVDEINIDIDEQGIRIKYKFPLPGYSTFDQQYEIKKESEISTNKEDLFKFMCEDIYDY